MSDLISGADEDLRARWDSLRLGYTESQGLPELRAEIARMYESVAPDEVLVAVPEEAIFLTMNSLLSAGDHVVCTFPGYQSLYELARGLGCELSFWEPVEGDEWRFDPADLEALLRPDTKLVVWNFPHNPTGALPSRVDYDRMIAAVRSAGRGGAWLFSDEMYRLLESDEAARLPAAVDRYERAMSLTGLSKAFGLAGLRLGWLTTHDESLLERISALKDYTTICSSAPSELLALMGLRARRRILARNRERLLRNIETASAFFERHREEMSWIPPQAGTISFPRLLTPGPGAARPWTGSEAFCEQVLRDTGVLLLPSTVYDYGDSHFRIGLGRDDSAFGLEVLDAYLGERLTGAHPGTAPSPASGGFGPQAL
jgi:aspartate/methionine/tyrosine aminotransferase